MRNKKNFIWAILHGFSMGYERGLLLPIDLDSSKSYNRKDSILFRRVN